MLLCSFGVCVFGVCEVKTGLSTQATHRLHTGYTQATHRLHTGYTQATHRLLTGYTQATHRLHTGYSQATHSPQRSTDNPGAASDSSLERPRRLEQHAYEQGGKQDARKTRTVSGWVYRVCQVSQSRVKYYTDSCTYLESKDFWSTVTPLITCVLFHFTISWTDMRLFLLKWVTTE